MYTEKSVELKYDFYMRYGRASGTLYFERTGIPCALMRSDSSVLAVAMRCGVRAYGRQYGDIIKIMNSEKNVFNIHFVENGRGAQILYKQDIEGMKGIDDVTRYTISKLMRRMGIGKADENSLIGICDKYGNDGWCAYCEGGNIQQIPMPMTDHNMLVVRTQKNGASRSDKVMRIQFENEEKKRIRAAAEGLKRCRTDVLFEMMNESEKSIERLLSPSKKAVMAVRAAQCADGVKAVRICDAGIVCFVESDRTDSAIHCINVEFEKNMGYPASIITAN